MDVTFIFSNNHTSISSPNTNKMEVLQDLKKQTNQTKQSNKVNKVRRR